MRGGRPGHRRIEVHGLDRAGSTPSKSPRARNSAKSEAKNGRNKTTFGYTGGVCAVAAANPRAVSCAGR